MQPATDFQGYCRHYFARLCRGYHLALDDTRVRAWLYGHKNPSDDRGAWDMSTRMFPALAAWLSVPARPVDFDLRGTRVSIEELARSILTHAFDPQHPGFWGKDEFAPRNQRTVESSILAYGAWLLRETLLPRIGERSRRLFEEWLAYFASAPLVKGNWNLFWIVNHAARKALGWSYDQRVLDEAWDLIEGLHRGGGWMTDGPECHFDDYNWWVFGTHEFFWMELDGHHDPARCARIRERIRERLADFPHFFGADGSYSEYGRSLSYKFARLGCPLHAYRHGIWPHSRGMLKRLVRRHLEYYDNNGALDRRFDTVKQELSEHGHPAVRDGYINTGHPYWCMHAFVGLWRLADDDPFWSCEEEPLPAEQADFRRAIVPAGWILSGVKDGGQVQRYSLGTQHGKADYAAKYGKFMYGSHFPVDMGSAAGDFGPDSALCLGDGEHWAHPGVYEAFACTQEFLRARYALQVGETTVFCETVLVPDGEACVRAHRLRIPKRAPALTAYEGGAAFGYAPGTAPQKRVTRKPPGSAVWHGARASLIVGLSGYDRGQRAQGFRGNERLNAIHDRAITPLLVAERTLENGGEVFLACYTLATLRYKAETHTKPDVRVNWKKDGTVVVKWAERRIEVPALV